ncbi:MAG: DsrE/DsrF/DrsH-like family protein [Candidatus Binatia bacterium]
MAIQGDGDAKVTAVTIDDVSLEQRIEELVEQKVAVRFAQLQSTVEQTLAQLKKSASPQLSDRTTLFVFSGDLDRLQAAFIIATGAAAMGQQVSMFFTFWGLAALKKQTVLSGKNLSEKMLALMLPTSSDKSGLSKLNMLGMGPMLLKKMMHDHHVESVPSLVALARELGVRLIACQMAMGVMGITKEELIEDIDYGGVATYLADATDSRLTLFI